MRLCLSIALLSVLAGCSHRPAARPAGAPRPQRIVSLAPSVTEMLFAVGAGRRVVATDDYSNYPPEAARLPHIGGVSVNYESVVALRPDLVVGVSDLQGASLRRVEGLGIPVLALDTTGYQKTIDAIRLLGDRAGDRSVAARAAERLEKAREDARKQARPGPAPTILAVAEAQPSLYVAGRGTFLDEMIRLAGGANAASIAGFGVESAESVVRRPPDIVLASRYDADALRKRFPSGVRVVVPPPDILVRPGPRLGDGLLWLAAEIRSVERGR